MIRQGIHRHHLAFSSFSSGLSQNHQLNRTCTNASPELSSRNAWNGMLSQGSSPTGRISAFTSQDTANMAHFGGQTGVVNSELCTRTIRGTVQLSSGLCYVEILTIHLYAQPPLLESTVGDHFASIVREYGDRTAWVIPFALCGRMVRLTQLACQCHF